jgi:hypothetical protein
MSSGGSLGRSGGPLVATPDPGVRDHETPGSRCRLSKAHN